MCGEQRAAARAAGPPISAKNSLRSGQVDICLPVRTRFSALASRILATREWVPGASPKSLALFPQAARAVERMLRALLDIVQGSCRVGNGSQILNPYRRESLTPTGGNP